MKYLKTQPIEKNNIVLARMVADIVILAEVVEKKEDKYWIEVLNDLHSYKTGERFFMNKTDLQLAYSDMLEFEF